MQKETENIETEGERTTGDVPRSIPLYNGYLFFIFKVKDLSIFVYRHIPVSSS